MSGKVTFRLPAAAAQYIRGSRDEKMIVVRGEGNLAPFDRVIVLFSLLQESDAEVRDGAREALRKLPDTDIADILVREDLHPRVLALLARLYGERKDVSDAIAAHPAADAAVMEILGLPVDAAVEPREGDGDGEEESSGEEAEEDDTEEYLSKYQLAQVMGVAEKIKMALTGDKEWRSILIKDANKLVSTAVIKNARITEAEVLGILKSSVQNDEILRIICHNKEWLKNYQIRKALVENHKTPLPTALRLVGTLSDKDVASLAKSKNISTVIATQARKLVLSKSKR